MVSYPNNFYKNIFIPQHVFIKLFSYPNKISSSPVCDILNDRSLISENLLYSIQITSQLPFQVSIVHNCLDNSPFTNRRFRCNFCSGNSVQTILCAIYLEPGWEIKLIHCSAPQTDVLSDKMVLRVVTQFLFHALPVFFIKYCYKLCIQRQINGGSMKACQFPSVWKILEKEFFYSLSTLILH